MYPLDSFTPDASESVILGAMQSDRNHEFYAPIRCLPLREFEEMVNNDQFAHCLYRVRFMADPDSIPRHDYQRVSRHDVLGMSTGLHDLEPTDEELILTEVYYNELLWRTAAESRPVTDGLKTELLARAFHEVMEHGSYSLEPIKN